MMIPYSILYAGLAGVVIALIVATATQRWELRVFVLLALRLAIGWHFLFEGLHKIHSQSVGPTDTSKPFTSEPFIAVGEGLAAEWMRTKYLGDPVKTYTERLAQSKPMTAEEFKKLKVEEQANFCPDPVAADLKCDDAKKNIEARATYAAWVYGAAGRDAKIKYVSGDVTMTGPQRLQHIELLQKEVKALEDRREFALGRGEGSELSRAKTARTELLAAKNDLAKDTESFINELRKDIGLEAMKPFAKEELKRNDKLTAWVITGIGAGLLLGLFTPICCLAGVGFLAMTWLINPTVPWLSLPPMTEGNPLFINKNIIEALALLVIAVHPTGRWLGLDALWTWLLFKPKAETVAV